MLGMPWHVERKPKIEYSPRKITVDNIELPLQDASGEGVVSISNLGVKKFRSLWRKKPNQSYAVFTLKNVMARQQLHQPNLSSTYPRLEWLLTKYNQVFQDDLRSRLPPEPAVEHDIITQNGVKPPHRPLFQLSAADLLASKEYVIDLLRK